MGVVGVGGGCAIRMCGFGEAALVVVLMGGEVLVAVYFPEFSAVAVLDGGAAVLEGVDDSFVAADAAGNGLFAPEGGVLAGPSGEAVAGDAEVVVGFATGGVGDFCGAAARELGVLIEPGFELLALS